MPASPSGSSAMRSCKAIALVLLLHSASWCPSFVFSKLSTLKTLKSRSQPLVRQVLSSQTVEPPVEDQQGFKALWSSAAASAVGDLRAGANATTLLMPSGAGDVEVGLEVVRGFLRTAEAAEAEALKLVVALPGSLALFAEEVYTESFRDEPVTVMSLARTSVSKYQIASTLRQNSTMILLCPYSMMLKFGLGFIESRIRRPLDLMVFATAHIVRAGGYHGLGAKDDVIPAKKRAFISARHLVGMAPGALLAPGQEPGFPTEAPRSKFGQEVFRLTHEDAEQRQLTVPIRLQIIDSSTAAEVAEELAQLHSKLGIRSIHVAPLQAKLANALNSSLWELTGGSCQITTGSSNSASSIDALLVAGTQPNYAYLAEEFPRLAKWQPDKRAGFIIVTGAAKHHASAAWMAFAIEDARAEEAIQRTSVEFGRINRRLKWNELPRELCSLVNRGNARKDAEMAIARGVEALGDPWDVWLGRLLAHKEWHKHANPRFLATQFGHDLGTWLKRQREDWEHGVLTERKVARLKGLGVMLNKEAEVFANGLSELRIYVSQQRTRTVPWGWQTDSGFRLGEWVVEQRTTQRRGKLSLQKQLLLKEAFFLWQPSQAPSFMFKHPEDPEAAEVTQGIEDELRSVRWQTIVERRGFFRAMVLKHHPDVSGSKYANDAIRFLAEAKEWFLAGY